MIRNHDKENADGVLYAASILNISGKTEFREKVRKTFLLYNTK